MYLRHRERHRTGRVAWLRAAVLGANDGILSTASLVLGVAAAHATHSSVMVAGVAGLVAGAMSMAAGEYVSVHSQADTEKADLKLERAELKTDNEGEHKELAAIYIARGLDPTLAKQVAEQLMAHDALGAHARDELGISKAFSARPIQAALASAASFAVGAALPLLVTATAPDARLIPFVAGTSVVPGVFGRVGCPRWGRRRDGWRNTGDVLGCSSHGVDSGRRGAIRNAFKAEPRTAGRNDSLHGASRAGRPSGRRRFSVPSPPETAVRGLPAFCVRGDHDFLEHRERRPGAGLFRSQGTVIVKADTDGYGDSFRAVSGPHKERVPELVCGPRLSHNRERKTVGIQCVSCAAGYAHDTAQTFLNERKRVAIDIDG